MAKAVAAHTFGEDYQYIMFWFHVCRLLLPDTKVDKVILEADDPKGIDDIVVINKVPKIDIEGTSYINEFYQVKFHMTSKGSITWEALSSPDFINASKISFLQRLKKAQELYSPAESRYFFVTPWIIHPDDLLAKLHDNTEDHLRLNILFDNKPKSKMAELRNSWMEHLELSDEESLRKLLFPLRISIGPSLFYIRNTLNDRLASAGLKPVDLNLRSNIYENLARKFIERNECVFDKETLREICNQEGLFLPIKNKSNKKVLAIRSFIRWTDLLEDQVDSMLCLSEYFDGRFICKSSWSEICSKIDDFLNIEILPGNEYKLHVPLHSSLTFYTGRQIPEKRGASVAIFQTSNGYIDWNRSKSEVVIESEISHNEIDVDAGELCLAISISHNIENDVLIFIENNLKNINSMIHYKIKDPSVSSIKNADESHYIATEIIKCIKDYFGKIRKSQRIHLFIAAPNILLFHLGQLSIPINEISMYEFDFESGIPGAYFNTINL